jgi:hypothetical protein
MIDFMGGPFRLNKKQRKRLRRAAKKAAISADKFESEGNRPDAVAVFRFSAKSDIAIAKSRKKKPKNSN